MDPNNSSSKKVTLGNFLVPSEKIIVNPTKEQFEDQHKWFKDLTAVHDELNKNGAGAGTGVGTGAGAGAGVANPKNKYHIEDKQAWIDHMNRLGYKSSTMKDGSIAFSDGRGNSYYNNGRMQSKDKKMSDYDYTTLSAITPKTPPASKSTITHTADPNIWNEHAVKSNRTFVINGKSYPVKVHAEQDISYAFDPSTGKYLLLNENWTGKPIGTVKGAQWLKPEQIASINMASNLGEGWSVNRGSSDDDSFYMDDGGNEQYLRVVYNGSNPNIQKGGYIYSPTSNKFRKLRGIGPSATYDSNWVSFNKNGNKLNKKYMTRYYQQGGAAPQQDMQQQVVALVQAAMQGDQKATQQVTQIMEAAKAGDQQAIQIAQIIQQVMQQMQGQATAAKWGAKLRYIRSLKYAKGGKTCPACMSKGGDVNKPAKANTPDTISKKPPMQKPLKKAEPVKSAACGGKAKKRYFGGWL